MSARCRILIVLAPHDAHSPLPKPVLLAQFDGPAAVEAEQALNELIQERQVMSCRVSRKSGPAVDVLWPAGKVVTTRSKAIARRKSKRGGHATAQRGAR